MEELSSSLLKANAIANISQLSLNPGLSTPSKNTILKSHGRPPWYDHNGRKLCDAFVIGIAGGSASGKTHVAQQIVRSLGSIPSVVIISQDSFYKHHNEEEIQQAFANRYDFDHPDAIDMPVFASSINDLKMCRQTHIPIYSFVKHQRLEETKYLYGAAIIIAEGIMALHDPGLRRLYDLKVFVQCDSDLMLARRIRRDVAERGRDVEGVLEQYLRFVKPAFDVFVQPTARYADIIVPGSENAVAIELISTHVHRMLQVRSTQLRATMSIIQKPLPACDNLIILEQTPQLKGIYTLLRNRNTSRTDFIFYAERLSNLIVERAVNELPFVPHSITVPGNEVLIGKKLGVEHLCGVTIMRAGGPLQRGLERVLRDVPIGSLLIQSDPKSGEPLLLHTMLPDCICRRTLANKTWVLLLDAQIGTGASALMAVRVLIDHGVPEDQIIFLTFLVAKDKGVAALSVAFPKLRIVVGCVDEHLIEVWLPVEAPEGTDRFRKVWIIQPGMGHIGDRYYI